MYRRDRRLSKRPPARKRLWERMEDRILFDAVPAGDLTNQFVPDGAADDAFVPSVDADAFSWHQRISSDGANQSPQQQRREIVFVDSAVGNYETLLSRPQRWRSHGSHHAGSRARRAGTDRS